MHQQYDSVIHRGTDRSTHGNNLVLLNERCQVRPVVTSIQVDTSTSYFFDIQSQLRARAICQVRRIEPKLTCVAAVCRNFECYRLLVSGRFVCLLSSAEIGVVCLDIGPKSVVFVLPLREWVGWNDG